MHKVPQNADGSGNYWILYTEGRAQETAFQAAELFGEDITRDLLITYLRERFPSSKFKDDTYQKFHSIRQQWNRQVQKISIIAPDLLMHRSRLPEDTISDYALIQQLFTCMHPRLHQDVEDQYTGEADINTVIATAERIDSIHRSTGAYGKTQYDKPLNNNAKNQESKPKKKFNIKSKTNTTKEPKKRNCFTYGDAGHMARNCPSKNETGKGKAQPKKEAASNLV